MCVNDQLIIGICLRSVGGVQNGYAAIFNAKALMRKGDAGMGMRQRAAQKTTDAALTPVVCKPKG